RGRRHGADKAPTRAMAVLRRESRNACGTAFAIHQQEASMIRRNTRLPDGRFVAALLVCMLPACGSDSGTGPSGEPGPGGETPAITLALSATSATVQQGGTTTLVATVMRTGGYTGAVDFAVQNTPTGVTAAQTNTQTVSGITTTTLTLQ